MTSIVQGGVTVAETGPYVIAQGSLQTSGVVARQSTVQLLDGGVSFTGEDVGEAGSISFEAFILGTSVDDCKGLVRALRAAWQPVVADVELTLTMGSVAEVYRGRPLSCVPVEDGTDTAVARCAFTVKDPKWYAAASRSAGPVSVGGASGGFVSPFVSPFVSTGSGSSGDVPVVNDGTAPAPWTAYVTATTTLGTPRLILDGQMVEIAGTVPAGSTLTVSSDGWVLLDGAPRPWLSWASTVWLIPPGASTFSFRAESGTGSALLVWRDASW